MPTINDLARIYDPTVSALFAVEATLPSSAQFDDGEGNGPLTFDEPGAIFTGTLPPPTQAQLDAALVTSDSLPLQEFNIDTFNGILSDVSSLQSTVSGHTLEIAENSDSLLNAFIILASHTNAIAELSRLGMVKATVTGGTNVNANTSGTSIDIDAILIDTIGVTKNANNDLVLPIGNYLLIAEIGVTSTGQRVAIGTRLRLNGLVIKLSQPTNYLRGQSGSNEGSQLAPHGFVVTDANSSLEIQGFRTTTITSSAPITGSRSEILLLRLPNSVPPV